MRILLTVDPELPVPPLFYGGVERIVDGLVRALIVRGHQVGLIAHPDSTCPATQFFSWPGTRSQHRVDSSRNIVALCKAVKDFRPDVVHSFSRLLYLLTIVLSTLPKIMSYQRHPGTRQVALGAWLGGRSLTFTGCSQYICDSGSLGGGAWHAVHNFVDTNVFSYQSHVSPDAPLVFLSRVERLKGVHMAIDIARRTGRRLLIAGNHGEIGAEGLYWRKEIVPALSPGVVEYVGPVTDEQKAQLLGGAAAMIVPVQWDEPFGIVFAEALACGTPVISCARGALPEIIRHGLEGFLISNVREGCEAVRRLAGISRLACRQRAENLFSQDVIVPKYERLYELAFSAARS